MILCAAQPPGAVAASIMCRCLYIVGCLARQAAACLQAFAVVGAFVGGWLARQRRLEVERMNRKLRRINRQLRKRKEQVRALGRAAIGALAGCGASPVGCSGITSKSGHVQLECGALLCSIFSFLCWCHEPVLPIWGCGPTIVSHTWLRFHKSAVLGRCARTLQEEELVCVATDEEALKAYRTALESALEGPSAAHPTEAFGDDNLSLSQARHRAVRWGSVAGTASHHSSCAVHHSPHAMQPGAVATHICVGYLAHGVMLVPFDGDLLPPGDHEHIADCGDCVGMTIPRHSCRITWWLAGAQGPVPAVERGQGESGAQGLGRRAAAVQTGPQLLCCSSVQ